MKKSPNGKHSEAVAVTAIDQEKIKLDIACGQNKQLGFTGVDIGGDADIIFDLETYPWTFAEDNSVDELWCSHYIEHVPDIIAFMNECYRILKPAVLKRNPNGTLEEDMQGNNTYLKDANGIQIGGRMTMIAPYYSSMRCWQDPTHVRAISEATFLYYNRRWLKMNRLDHGPYLRIKADFDYSFGYQLEPDIAARNLEYQQFAVRHYINAVSDIQLVFTKRE